MTLPSLFYFYFFLTHERGFLQNQECNFVSVSAKNWPCIYEQYSHELIDINTIGEIVYICLACTKFIYHFILQVELSSSSGNVGLISEKDFYNFKRGSFHDSDNELNMHRQSPKMSKTKSMTLSSSLIQKSEEEPKSSLPVKEVSTSILSSTSLHVNAPEFKPRPRNDNAPLSSSLPSTIPNFISKHPRRNRNDYTSHPSRGRRRNVPRFYPAIVKDDLHNKVCLSWKRIFDNVLYNSN